MVGACLDVCSVHCRRGTTLKPKNVWEIYCQIITTNMILIKTTLSYSIFYWITSWIDVWCIGRYGIGWYGVRGFRKDFRNALSCMPCTALFPPRKFGIIGTILPWRATVLPNSTLTSFPMMYSIHKCRRRGTVEKSYKNNFLELRNLDPLSFLHLTSKLKDLLMNR